MPNVCLDLVTVLWPGHRFYGRIPLAEATVLLSNREAVEHHCRGQRLKSVRLVRAPEARREPGLTPGRGGMGRSAYSHCHETDDNPEGVWTLRHIADEDRAVFLTSITDCLVTR